MLSSYCLHIYSDNVFISYVGLCICDNSHTLLFILLTACANHYGSSCVICDTSECHNCSMGKVPKADASSSSACAGKSWLCLKGLIVPYHTINPNLAE